LTTKLTQPLPETTGPFSTSASQNATSERQAVPRVNRVIARLCYLTSP